MPHIPTSLTRLTFGILTWLTWRPDSTPPARVTTLWEKIILEKLIFPGMVSLKSEMPQARPQALKILPSYGTETSMRMVDASDALGDAVEDGLR